MKYLADRELKNSCSPDIVQKENRDIEECRENAKLKEEIEKSFEENFNPAILGKAIV